jgi:hypothetical protein
MAFGCSEPELDTATATTAQLLDVIKFIQKRNAAKIEAVIAFPKVEYPLQIIALRTPPAEVIPACFATEICLEQKTEDVLVAWRGHAKIIEVEDLFDKSIRYNVSVFADIKRLNDEMLSVAVKYGSPLFRSEGAVVELRKFVSNYRELDRTLEGILTAFKDKSSRAEETARRLAAINSAITALVHDVGVSFAGHPSLLALGITAEHIGMLSDSIAKTGEKKPWELQYRATVHGWDTAAFRTGTQGKPRMLIIFRDSVGQVFGCFTRVGFTFDNTPFADKDSFLFSFNSTIVPAVFPSTGAVCFTNAEHNLVETTGKELVIAQNPNTSYSRCYGFNQSSLTFVVNPERQVLLAASGNGQNFFLADIVCFTV